MFAVIIIRVIRKQPRLLRSVLIINAPPPGRTDDGRHATADYSAPADAARRVHTTRRAIQWTSPAPPVVKPRPADPSFSRARALYITPFRLNRLSGLRYTGSRDVRQQQTTFVSSTFAHRSSHENVPAEQQRWSILRTFTRPADRRTTNRLALIRSP